jgi:thiol-disulfide isomerase/thioredoxin
MRTRLLALGILLFSTLLVGMHFRIKEQPDVREIDRFVRESQGIRLWPGRVAPDFEVDTLDGNKFHLADEVGKKVILVNFFATWCEPCRKEIPELSRFSAGLSKDPWLIVFVDAGEEAPLVRKFADEFHLPAPVGIDHAQRIQRLYGVTSYPTNVLIGADGKVQLYEPGAIRNADVTLQPLVSRQLPLVKAGQGIGRDAFIAASAAEDYHPVRPAPVKSASHLDGRALRIAQAMDCLCGCSKKVDACGCNNASKVKKALASRKFGEESDADVMRELGKQFCMEAM